MAFSHTAWIVRDEPENATSTGSGRIYNRLHNQAPWV